MWVLWTDMHFDVFIDAVPVSLRRVDSTARLATLTAVDTHVPSDDNTHLTRAHLFFVHFLCFSSSLFVRPFVDACVDGECAQHLLHVRIRVYCQLVCGSSERHCEWNWTVLCCCRYLLSWCVLQLTLCMRACRSRNGPDIRSNAVCLEYGQWSRLSTRLSFRLASSRRLRDCHWIRGVAATGVLHFYHVVCALLMIITRTGFNC